VSTRELTVTKLERHHDGYWTARVSVNGETVAVHLRCGAWYANVPGKPGHLKGVLPPIAAALAEKVRILERRERERLERRREAAVASGRVPCLVASRGTSSESNAQPAHVCRVRIQLRDLSLAS
jgi:hypothetical protein